jgi:hypothetical protein
MALTACSSGDDPKADPKPASLKLPEPGQCIAKEIADLDDVAPDLSSVVPCDKAHIFEIVDVFDVPATFLGDAKSRPERLARRKELLTVAGTDHLRKTFAAAVSQHCRAAELKPSRMSSLRLEGKTAEEARVGFVFGGAQSWFNGTPATLWADGHASVICSVRFTTHVTDTEDVDAKPVTSKNDRPVWQRFRTVAFPLDRRQCLTYDEDDYQQLITCDKQHYGEYLFSYDARSVFGKSFVDSVNIADVTDKQWEKLSKPCFDALYTLFGDDFDEDLSGDGEIGEIGWGQTDDDTDMVDCLAIPYDSDEVDLPGGTLFDESTDVDFVSIVPHSDA